MNHKHRRGALKAARLYLEMRGHKLLEQGWSSGRHKIDLIAAKDNLIEFVCINYAAENEAIDITENAERISRLKEAQLAWTTDNRYQGHTKCWIIEVYGDGYAVLSFNEV